MASANNIAELRDRRGWSRPELGRRMGTSGQQVERLEKGQRRLTREWIDKAADALGVSAVEIISPEAVRVLDEISGASPVRLPAPVNDDDIAEITALDLSLSMGPGTLIEEFVESEPVKLSLWFIQAITRTPTDMLRLVRGIGDSMEPTLRSSDRILVDINDRQLSRAHGVYWIDHLGTHGIKRLRAAGKGRVLIMSDNERVPDYEVDADELRIEGRAIWFARDL